MPRWIEGLRCTQHWFAPDGTDIAYAIEGAGSALVLHNGLTTSTAFWRYLHPRWTQRHQVLRWDLPGHGDSGPARTHASATIAGQPDLVAGLMNETGVARAVHVGWSTGCQVALELALRHPSRCAGLVLLLGSAGAVFSTSTLPLPGHVLDAIVRHTPPRAFHAVARTMATLTAAPLGDVLPRRLGLIGRYTSTEDAASITQHLRSIDTHTVQTMIASAHAHSVWDRLGELNVPVLIVSGDLDPFAPADPVGLRMHAAITRSTFVRLPQGTHTALFDHADAISDAVEQFLTATRW